MIQYTNTIPFYHLVFKGSSSELLSAPTAIGNMFYEEDTGNVYVFEGVGWNLVVEASIPIIETPSVPPPPLSGFGTGFDTGFK